jgi:hypothetical protein
MQNPALHTITAISTFFITLRRGKQCYKKGDFWFIVFLNFIARKRVTFAKFISEKKDDFLFICFQILMHQKV